MKNERFISIFFPTKNMGDFNAGANYSRAKDEMREEVCKRVLKLLDDTKGVLNLSTEKFVKQSVEFLRELGLEGGEFTELRKKLASVQDKERLIWEIRVPEGVHYCDNCTTENYHDDGCHMCDYSGRAGDQVRKYCKLGHTTICIVRDEVGHNKGIMIGDHFRTVLGRPTK